MKKNIQTLIPVAIISIVALAYVSWQLIGLRFTNHDDIYFHLYSWVFSGDYLGFTADVAAKQARLQAYIGMPTLLWATHLYDSYLYDVFNIGSFVIFYLSLTWFLAKIGTTKDALGIVAVTLFLFPLHYYFSFPQGYPVVVSMVIACGFISAGLLGSHLQKPSPWKFIISILLFIFSLWGSEYNFILHPALIILILFSREKFDIDLLKRTSWPYVTVWLISLLVYLYFSIGARENGGNESGRVSFGFDLVAWINTLSTLQIKAFLPSALWAGISSTSAIAQGSPEVSALITFSSIFHGTHDSASIIIIFLVAFIIFWNALSLQNNSTKSIVIYALFFCSFAFIPAAVLATSVHYQFIVGKGYLQGHLASFYTQLGFSALTFLMLSYACNRLSNKLTKLIVISLAAIILASFATTTFVYNNINRQLMTANKQKWEAVRDLAMFVHSDRPDLIGSLFYAPALWAASGVSSIPGDSTYTGENYWTEYSKSALNIPIKFTKSDIDLPSDFVEVAYFATPAGNPIAALLEKTSQNQKRRITLIASKAVTGTLYFQREGAQTRKISAEKWVCTKLCTTTWEELISFQPDSIYFEPDFHGESRLIYQFMVSRDSEYSYPMGFNSKNVPTDIKIINWGPQASFVGVVPNLQPDGSAGIWIKFSGGVGIGEIRLFFDGKEAKSTSLSPELITAAISAESFNTPGEKDIYIKQVSTGVMFPVGKFIISK